MSVTNLSAATYAVGAAVYLVVDNLPTRDLVASIEASADTDAQSTRYTLSSGLKVYGTALYSSKATLKTYLDGLCDALA